MSYWDQIQGAAKRCQAVYVQAHLIPAHKAFSEFDGVEVFRSHRTVVAVAHDSERVFFTARGTDPRNKSAVMNDCRAVLTEERYLGRVHLGGRQELDHVWEKSREHVRELTGNGTRRLYCEGHSLGGLIAELFYARVAREEVSRCLKNLPYGLTTLGKPHGGDSDYAAWVDGVSNLHRMREEREAFGHCRIINGTDIVARLPPTWLLRFRKYNPSGIEFRFCGDQLLREPYRLRVWSRWAKQRFGRHPIAASFYDHQIEAYADRMAAVKVQKFVQDSGRPKNP